MADLVKAGNRKVFKDQDKIFLMGSQHPNISSTNTSRIDNKNPIGFPRWESSENQVLSNRDSSINSYW